MLRNRFFNFQVPRPLWNPPGEGTGGGGDGGEDELGIDLDDSTDPLLEGDGGESGDDDSGDGGEISLDGPSAFDKLFEPDDDDDDDDNSDDEEDSELNDQAALQALTTELQETIKGIALPETAIPDDFDPTDRTQLRNMLSSVQRDTVQHSLRVMWKPMAAAINQTIVRMRAEMQETVANGVGDNNLNQMISKAIPNYNKPSVKAVADVVLAQAKKRYPGDPRRQVAATQKALISAGVKIGAPGSNPRHGGGGTGRSARQATDATLDMFAKLPRRVTSNDRLKNRLQKK